MKPYHTIFHCYSPYEGPPQIVRSFTFAHMPSFDDVQENPHTMIGLSILKQHIMLCPIFKTRNIFYEYKDKTNSTRGTEII